MYMQLLVLYNAPILLPIGSNIGALGVYRVLLGKLEGRNHWGDLGVDGWIILGWISRRWDVDIWTGLGWPRIETGGGRF